jgi:alkanesulfonate monooxygenase SsuD/methylene tetrahydromethanopterin reductase-like flavin-dependent oxidoreductase (luciferase family)
MKFGLIYDFRNPAQWRRPWVEFYERMLGLAVESETLGYDHVWLTEHHFVDDGYLPSIVPVAAAIAARTKRIRIGSDIMILPFQDPVRIAEDLAVVDILSGGRFDLGVGQGYRAEEFRAIGMERRERHARTRESVELIQKLWTEADVRFEGRYFRVDGVTISPRPVQQPHIPIWIGARTEKAMLRAARAGHHLTTTLGPDLSQLWRRALTECGRKPEDANMMGLTPAFVAPTSDEAWAAVQDHLHYQMKLYADWLGEANDAEGDQHVWDYERAEDVRKSEFGQSLPIGTAEEVSAKLETIVAQTAPTHMALLMHFPGADPERTSRSMRLFAERVMPEFRGRP